MAIQKGPLAFSKGTIPYRNRPVPTSPKEHIANREQIVYIAHHSGDRRQRGRVCRPPESQVIRSAAMSPACPACRRRFIHGQVEGAGCRAHPDRARLRQGLDHAARQERQVDGDRDGLDRLARARYRARHRRPAARPRRRNLRAGILRQDHAGAAHASPKRRRRAASAPSSMPSMRSIRSMRASSASMSTIC